MHVQPALAKMSAGGMKTESVRPKRELMYQSEEKSEAKVDKSI